MGKIHKILLFLLVFQLGNFNTNMAMKIEIDKKPIETFNPYGGKFNNPLVQNVEQQFNNMLDNPTTIGAHNPGIIEYPNYIYSGNDNNFGKDNHFQGIIRFPRHLGLGQYFALSGSDKDDKTSNLFIIKINSQNKRIFNTNIKKGKPNEYDNIIQNIKLSKSLYHAGGMQTCGQYLAIPLEGRSNGRVWFYKCSERNGSLHLKKIYPENPKYKYQPLEVRTTSYHAGTVAFIKLSDGYYLVGVWTDDKGLFLYESNKPYLKAGFKRIAILKRNLFQIRNEPPQYQMINFVQDLSGKLYLIGTENTSNISPIINKKRVADLFQIKIKDQNMSITLKNTKTFNARNTSNFDAGCGIYIPNQANMFMYSCHHFLTERMPSCCFYGCFITNPEMKTFVTIDQYT